MKKIAVLIFMFLTHLSFAQVEFETKVSRTKIGINENVRVDFTMNEDGDNLELPSFENFKIIGGPYQQISNSFINGKRTYSKSFGFTLQPTKQGVLTIESASITIKGNIYKTDPVEITVTGPVQRPNDLSVPIMEVNESVHLIAQVSKKNPYVNEPITVLYKLYFKDGVGVRDYGVTANPEYKDFWSHNIEMQGYETKSEIYKGESYTSAILKKVVLYPQKSGKLTLSPLDLEMILELPTNRRDIFGRRAYTTASTKISSGSTIIDVKSLPEANQPEDFTGAVGTFDFTVTPSKTLLRYGESLDLNLSISGKGNLELFSIPEPTVPSALEMYDPVFNKQISVALSGMYGKISNKYTIIPQYKGKYIIKPISFSYFDLATNSYKTLTSQEIMIEMIDGPISDDQSDTISGISNTFDKNIFEPNEVSTNLNPIIKKDFLFSRAFYIWLLIPFLLIPIVILIKRNKDIRDSDIQGNKIRSNSKLARKYLSEAKKNQGNKNEFYFSLERALHNFLKAKLQIETTDLSKEIISENLLERNADIDSVKDLISLLETAELVRYAPSLASTVNQDYEKAVTTITNLEKKIK